MGEPSKGSTGIDIRVNVVRTNAAMPRAGSELCGHNRMVCGVLWGGDVHSYGIETYGQWQGFQCGKLFAPKGEVYLIVVQFLLYLSLNLNSE